MSWKDKIITTSTIVFLQLLVTILVYSTGGIQFVYSHSMYVPIVMAALVFGYKGGLLAGLTGGLLLGPLMPVNTTTGLMQEPLNWIYRAAFFMIIGYFSGFFAQKISEHFEERLTRYMFLTGTDIPLVTQMHEQLEPLGDAKRHLALLNLKITNREDLIGFFTYEKYRELLVALRDRLQATLPENHGIYAQNSEGLCIVFDKKHLEVFPQMIQESLNESFVVATVPIFIETTIGATAIHSDFETALNKTMVAMRNAERNQQDYIILDETRKKVDDRDLKILGAVKQSLQNDDFHMVYQPKINLATGRIIGAEALLRWRHPIYGDLKPGAFIPLIERTSLINPLTEWIIDKVLSTLSINRKSLDPDTCPIAINLSSNNLFAMRFYEKVITKLKAQRLNSNNIQFEITESLLMKNPEKSIKTMQLLKDYNISLSIDDFGTGYSSLAYLSRFPVSEIKIDRLFIENMFRARNDMILVETAIDLAKRLNIDVLAEGVETEQQKQILSDLACTRAQGFYFAEPMTFKALIKHFENQ